MGWALGWALRWGLIECQNQRLGERHRAQACRPPTPTRGNCWGAIWRR
jgi:hypothetical protein